MEKKIYFKNPLMLDAESKESNYFGEAVNGVP